MAATESPPSNIVLVGFMGCGKSTVGRELRKLLGYPLVDTDRLIEARAGCSISELFARGGEQAFRELETEVLRELAGAGGGSRIIATGGGIILREENRTLLRSLGCVVWLRAPVETIVRRTGRSRERPLLRTADPQARIEALLAERDPYYRSAAHLDVDTEGLSCNEVACGILESARYFFAGKAGRP